MSQGSYEEDGAMRNTFNRERAVEKYTRKIGILAAAAAFVGIGSAARADDLLFDWQAQSAATTPVTGYTPAPFVGGGNSAANAVTVLTAAQASNPGHVAVKIVAPLSAADTATLFNNPNFTVNYAFLDFEAGRLPGGPSTNSDTAAAAAQAAAIRAQAKGGGTFIGNFRMFPGSGDTSGVGAGPSVSDYLSSTLNMANPDLYPGDPSYKNPGSSGGTSTSPNIRSTLFTLPINRLTYSAANLPAGNKLVPYVDRFNSFGNTGLNNSTVNGQAAFSADAAHGTSGQLLSRGDFSALVAHYRLRGADGVHLLDGGVVGYTQQQFEQDAKDGWTLPQIANIMADPNHRIATLDTVSRVDGVVKSNESSGVVYSGVYSLTQAGGAGKLALLVSNMDDISHTVDFPQKIGGKSIAGSVALLAGQHKLLDFTGSGTQWTLQNPGGTVVFADSNRDGVGVPEPVAMGGASIFALTMLFRRRRSR
jgi:hypothetical protein